MKRSASASASGNTVDEPAMMMSPVTSSGFTSGSMTLPSTTANLGMISAGVKLPPNPTARPSPLTKITPVTEAMLSSPSPSDWIDGRRTRDAQGFSPLNQINTGNVDKLRLSWSLSLPPGPNQNTPLVHDGVMFVHAFKDVLQAVDAVNGDILWQYIYRLPKDVTPTPKKSIALYESMVFMPTFIRISNTEY